MQDIKNQVIFISPLDWGLGHASRCVPIIEELSKSNTVIIGTTNLNERYFNYYFPQLQKIKVPSYQIRYSKIWPVYLKILFQAPAILWVIRKEKILLQSIVKQFKIDLIISDNRFGFFHREIKSIFITHQLNLKVPFLAFLANSINRKFIHQFNEVWVPDYEEINSRLSGELSDSSSIKIPVNYIGPKSALSHVKSTIYSGDKIDLLVLLSGEEPQRSILENELINVSANQWTNMVLVRGTLQKRSMQNNTITYYNELFGEELKQFISRAEKIICRSGYSTLMDLHLMDKTNLVLIPTPGQSEQEYLAIYWKERFGAKVCAQGKLKAANIF